VQLKRFVDTSSRSGAVGRGGRTNTHHGNQRHRHLVELNLDFYRQTGNANKQTIYLWVLEGTLRTGGRFLKMKDSESKQLVQMKFEEARVKCR